MKTKIALIGTFIFLALLLSNCMVIVDMVKASKETAVTETPVPETIPSETPVKQEASSETKQADFLDYPITLINGETTTLRDHQGQTVLLVFFSVHCGHCHNESSHLEAIYQDYKDQNFIIISAEVSGADLDTITGFADEYEITFPIGMDNGAQFAYFMDVTGVPHNLLIDKDGNVASVIRGFSNEESLRSSIELQLGN
ncbi:MAG: redoxin domain-containing protein [Anaerolineae bacterium]|jgi:peroxiredoxin|nr:redoxin domain-containing protein [Anaerolineae bacterium]